jgi:hypothetical protein
MLKDLTEAPPVIRTELNVKTYGGRQLFFGSIHGVATLDFVREDFARRFLLPTRKPKVKNPL